MCHPWVEEGSHTIDNEAVRRCAEIIPKIDPFGHLHIIVDDWNIDDHHIESCQDYVNKNEHESTKEVLALENQLLSEFRAMSVGERNSALALADGIWKTT